MLFGTLGAKRKTIKGLIVTRRNRLQKFTEGFIKICESPINFAGECTNMQCAYYVH